MIDFSKTCRDGKAPLKVLQKRFDECSTGEFGIASVRSVTLGLLMLAAFVGVCFGQNSQRPRLRELGVKLGIFDTGKWNAITDVEGVLVGHVTLVSGESIRTGVTAILPHPGNVYLENVPGAISVGNGFGKLMGLSQVRELGTIETPILLTGTLNVPRVADALIDHMLALPGMENVRSINPIVGETNDGILSDAQIRPVSREHVFESIRNARTGPVLEGTVGAGTGTICFGFKGGIGTSSRVLPSEFGGFTVGVLVQTNFDGLLQIGGAPVGIELGSTFLKAAQREEVPVDPRDGSCMIVVATNAPLDSRNLERLAKRAILGMAATGSASSNGSGDYAIAFSTARNRVVVRNEAMTPLFQAVREATEEAILNSLLKATSTKGRRGRTVEAISIEALTSVLRRYGVIR